MFLFLDFWLARTCESAPRQSLKENRSSASLSTSRWRGQRDQFLFEPNTREHNNPCHSLWPSSCVGPQQREDCINASIHTCGHRPGRLSFQVEGKHAVQCSLMHSFVSFGADFPAKDDIHPTNNLWKTNRCPLYSWSITCLMRWYILPTPSINLDMSISGSNKTITQALQIFCPSQVTKRQERRVSTLGWLLLDLLEYKSREC